ncbi:signal transduction histidine kinase [Clostridium acetobutylicum]|uniref:sensor histidine kinase n=1 Tax=Clostridium TaxID=1485 RepID=UPI000200A6F9|nr:MULTISPECIES: sensor histidine kinase [Clostridium]ADZ19218.1 sensory transduction protein kinase [Clostridium acetobutylicum EA 2018]AEI31094.1 sensory transduction protein kinase [Clostridium acetobutylicum DSM 1731]AWV81962.1 sensor histidine kinase [Clostridium acetobutylicum]MBC2395970.1 sensor histidine kinase [Clostridium acetobutylicum]MBC2586181.1 sensor histidine kinase [Clostridium acetobutylicum]
MKFNLHKRDKLSNFVLMQNILALIILDNFIRESSQIINIILVLFLIIDNCLMIMYNNKLKYIIFSINNLIVGYLYFGSNSKGIMVYYYTLIIYIVAVKDKKFKGLLILNFVTYLFANRLFSSKLLNYHSVLNVIFDYGVNVVIYFLIRIIIIEKSNSKKLNQKLNATKENYLDKIRELAIKNERTKIAEELHDSIGHSLVALNMNLEYAENIIDVDSKKASTTIKNCYMLSKDCIKTLREAVTILRDIDITIINLKEDIEKMFSKFENTQKCKLSLNLSEDIESISAEIKSCVFKTLRESITNGIKHGKATYFKVDIFREFGNVIMNIENNGEKCEEIVPSNGIIGMKNRVHLLKGEISFIPNSTCGFTVKVKIPSDEGGQHKLNS